jgi:hypothetical protein
MTERVNNIILEALQSGVPPQIIFDNLRQTDDPDIQVYLKRYQQNIDDFNKPAPKEETPSSQVAATMASGAPTIGPKEAAIAGGTAGLVGVGAKILYDKSTKSKEPVAPDEKVSGAIRSPAQEEMEKLKLDRERIKTERAKVEYENWLTKNTFSEAEKVLGRKIKDPADQIIADRLLAQQQKAGFGQGPSLQSVVPSTQPTYTTSNQAPNVTTSLPDLKQEASNIALATETADNIAANKTQLPSTVNQQLTPPTSTGTPNGQTVSNGNTSKQAVEPVLKAEEQQKIARSFAQKFADKKAELNFKSEADIPEGYVLRKDVGNLDRSMGNILGKEHRQYAREMFTGGQPFGHSENLNKDVSKLTTEYFQRLQSEIPETILSRSERKSQGIPSDFGTYAKNTNFGRGVKVAGVAGTLLAVADIANAAQKGSYLEAGLRGADLATDYIPGVAQIKQGLSPFDVGAGSTLSLEQIQQAKNINLLGSPYAQTEQAKKLREKEAYARKVGAGRGIAPPSAYMR